MEIAGKQHRSLIFTFVFLLMLLSCRKTAPGFENLVSRIDQNPLSADRSLYLQAARMAESSSERLIILKRAMTHRPDTELEIATLFSSQFSHPHSIGLLLSSIFLDNRRFSESLEAFRKTFTVSEKPELLAEIFIKALASGTDPGIDLQDLNDLAHSLDNPDFFQSAALKAMMGGNLGLARSFLLTAIDNGARIPVRLLWDAGLYEEIIKSPVRVDDALELNIQADSAWIAGYPEIAKRLYMELVEAHPSSGWKPWAALARMAEDSRVTEDDLLVPFAPSWSREPASATDEVGQWYAGMAEYFSEIEVLKEMAAYYLRQKNPANASRLLEELPADPEVSSGIRLGVLMQTEPEKAIIEAVSLAYQYPESSIVNKNALLTLYSAGAWNEYIESEKSRHVELDYDWFWVAARMLLEGDAARAAEIVRSKASGEGSALVSWNLAVLELSAGRYQAAAEAFVTAANEPWSDSRQSEKYRIESWLMAGEAWHKAGKRDLARDAYRAALSIDPLSRNAKKGLEKIEREE